MHKNDAREFARCSRYSLAEQISRSEILKRQPISGSHSYTLQEFKLKSTPCFRVGGRLVVGLNFVDATELGAESLAVPSATNSSILSLAAEGKPLGRATINVPKIDSQSHGDARSQVLDFDRGKIRSSRNVW